MANMMALEHIHSELINACTRECAACCMRVFAIRTICYLVAYPSLLSQMCCTFCRTHCVYRSDVTPMRECTPCINILAMWQCDVNRDSTLRALKCILNLHTWCSYQPSLFRLLVVSLFAYTNVLWHIYWFYPARRGIIFRLLFFASFFLLSFTFILNRLPSVLSLVLLFSRPKCT